MSFFPMDVDLGWFRVEPRGPLPPGSVPLHPWILSDAPSGSSSIPFSTLRPSFVLRIPQRIPIRPGSARPDTFRSVSAGGDPVRVPYGRPSQPSGVVGAFTSTSAHFASAHVSNATSWSIMAAHAFAKPLGNVRCDARRARRNATRCAGPREGTSSQPKRGGEGRGSASMAFSADARGWTRVCGRETGPPGSWRWPKTSQPNRRSNENLLR